MRDLVSITGLSIQAIKKNMKILRDLGILERHGSARKGSWEVSDTSEDI